jgi:hypothetical protein
LLKNSQNLCDRISSLHDVGSEKRLSTSALSSPRPPNIVENAGLLVATTRDQ